MKAYKIAPVSCKDFRYLTDTYIYRILLSDSMIYSEQNTIEEPKDEEGLTFAKCKLDMCFRISKSDIIMIERRWIPDGECWRVSIIGQSTKVSFDFASRDKSEDFRKEMDEWVFGQMQRSIKEIMNSKVVQIIK